MDMKMDMKQELLRRTAEFLAELGDSAEAVALKLRQRGCTGMPDDPGTDPIVEAGEKVGIPGLWIFPGETYVAVPRTGRIWKYFPPGHHPVPNPPAIVEFVQRFDAGEFLELMREPAAA